MPFVFSASLPSRARPEIKAILLPFGDHAGEKLSLLEAVSFVSGVAPVPSAFTTQMLEVKFVLAAFEPSRAPSEATAMRLPSGDHAGCTTSVPVKANFVMGADPLPSGFTTQTLSLFGPLLASLPSRARF